MSFKSYFQAFLSGDWKSGITVFLVALPLCLGIALASGAPLFSGLIAGMVGGIVVGALSGSQLSVSGPAAGLTVIVYQSIQSLPSFSTFLLAVVLAGCIQLSLGLFKMGKIAGFFPSSVIRGMLVAIGIVIILKQIPHAIGDDLDFEGDFAFKQMVDGENSISEIFKSLVQPLWGALIISGAGLVLMAQWPKWSQRLSFLGQFPPALVAVLMGVALNESFALSWPTAYLGASSNHMVNLPILSAWSDLSAAMNFPDLGAWNNTEIYMVALTLAIVASLESLLSLEASDALDPQKRISSPDKELFAQGIGNIASGFLGGLPITSVIVRSSTNIYAGAQTRASGIFHGLLLMVAVLALPGLLNHIPLASLASVLLFTGYKLAHPKEFKKVFTEGWKQYIPFLCTILVVVFVDLLWGIFIGTLVGLLFVVISNYQSAISVFKKDQTVLIKFQKDLSFLHKMALKNALMDIKPGCVVYIDARNAPYMDHDIRNIIEGFVQTASLKNIEVDLKFK